MWLVAMVLAAAPGLLVVVNRRSPCGCLCSCSCPCGTITMADARWFQLLWSYHGGLFFSLFLVRMKNGNGKKVRAGHTSATELFRGMEVTINFHKGIQVKDSIQSSLIVYGSDMVFKASLRR